MAQFEFNSRINRRGTGCNKWDGRFPAIDNYGREILHFTIADMDFPSPACIADALKTRVEHPIFGYTHPEAGLYEAFLGWMRRRHGVSLEEKHLKATNGILTGIAFAIRSIVSPGDRMMVFTPVYPPFFDLIRGAGCELVECPLTRESGKYTMDLNAVEREMKQGLKGILFCNPHNPAGRVWSREELDALTDLCVKYGVYLFSDEAHADFGLFGHTYTPVCSIDRLDGLAVSCLSPNKSFNVPGISSAFLICKDPKVLDNTSSELKSAGISCPPIFSMVAAEAGYRGADAWMDEVNRYIEENSMYVRTYIETHMPNIIPAAHEGTFLLWLDIGCFGKTDEELARELAMEYGVQLSAGARYRGDGGKHLRFNIAAPKELLSSALDRMSALYQGRPGRS